MALVPLAMNLAKKCVPTVKQVIDSINNGSDEEMSYNGSNAYNESMNNINNGHSGGFASSIKRGTTAVFEKYKLVRRLIVFALLCLLSYLVWAVVTVYLSTGLVAQGMVDIIEIFCGILTIFSCYYTYSRAKECNTKTMHTSIAHIKETDDEPMPPEDQDIEK